MKIYTYTISKSEDYERDLNVVIPTPSIEKDLFKKAKKSLEENAKHVNLNIYLNAVVDSGPNFRFSRSVNRGLEEIDADFYLNMNDDVILDSHALHYAIQDFDKINNLGLLGAILYWPDGRIQNAGIELKKCNNFLKFLGLPWLKAPFYSLKLYILEKKLAKKYNWAYPICGKTHISLKPFKGVFVGAFHMFSQEIYILTRGYDEEYIMGTEDVDFCLTVLKYKKYIRIDKRIRAIHYHHGSGFNYGIYQKNRKEHFFKKWKPEEIITLIEDNGELIF